MSYPFIANYIFEHRTDSLVNTVRHSAESVDHAERLKIFAKVREYNQAISSGSIQLQDPFLENIQIEETESYFSLLNVNQDNVMGIVEIPCIDVKLPVYHGTSREVLEKGIGHLQGTSLPIGGKSTHSVLTGHTGLSNAKLFTDLAEVQEEDVFFLNIIGEKLAYRVDQIKVVSPTELSDLYVVNDEDYCTLVTCTPYGINTHRLLVRGTRIDYKKTEERIEEFKKKPRESRWMREYQRALTISMVVFGFGLTGVFLYQWCSRRMIKKE